MTIPDADTRLCGVIGHPISHSLSPQIHNAALRHEGRNGIYLAFDVPPDRFAGAIDGLGAVGCVGLSVTIPHKVAALERAKTKTAECERVGAANVLVFGSAGLEAHNTDVHGVARALEDLGVEVAGARCLLLGAGGAGRAAAWALVGAGAARVEISNRTPERADDLARAMSGEGEAVTVPWAERSRRAREVEIIVNATSMGLTVEESPLDTETLQAAGIGACRGVLDLVYGREDTPLVRLAHEAGLPAADGIGMLVYQAAEAYRWFWGAAPDVGVMMQAAQAAVGRRGAADGEGAASRPPIV